MAPPNAAQCVLDYHQTHLDSRSKLCSVTFTTAAAALAAVVPHLSSLYADRPD